MEIIVTLLIAIMAYLMFAILGEFIHLNRILSEKNAIQEKAKVDFDNLLTPIFKDMENYDEKNPVDDHKAENSIKLENSALRTEADGSYENYV